jgi:predicted MFS family arabinose efflux permease
VSSPATGPVPVPVVLALGTTQTIAWASTYYLPAVLAAPQAAEFGCSTVQILLAVSAALGVSACLGPWAGRCVDAGVGRRVLVASSLLVALGLLLQAAAEQLAVLWLSWFVLGVAMGLGLYETAFAVLVRLGGASARSAITGVALMAGFASTVGWPLSALMAQSRGWRGACVGWALLHLAVALPLHAWLPRPPAAPVATAAGVPVSGPVGRAWSRRSGVLLATAFASTWFTSTAMAAHLPQLLLALGLSAAAAVGAAALVGPAQVAARLLEFGLLRRCHPLYAARWAAAAHPVAVLLVLSGAPAAAFAVLHGAGNGVLTIAKGTLPLALAGPTGYGQRQGWLMVPARIAQALAPATLALALEQGVAAALLLSAAVGAVGCVALLALRARPTASVAT